MTEKIYKLLKDSPAMRWTALVLLASAMFFAYMFVDILSPLQAMLQETKGWDPAAYGTYQGSETFLNVFVFFLYQRLRVVQCILADVDFRRYYPG